MVHKIFINFNIYFIFLLTAQSKVINLAKNKHDNRKGVFFMQAVYVEQKDGVSVFNLQGRIDASNSNQIHEKIMDEIESGASNIVINFSEVSYISSAGLRILVYTSKTMKKKSGTLSICAMSKNIEKIFQISGLMGLFDVHSNLEASLSSVQQ